MNDVKPDYDFRDQEPLWVKYAELISPEHDKFYEVRIDLTDEGEFCLTKRWGARPDRGRGQIKPEYFQSMSRAMGVADGQLADKLRKGYRIAERPMAANNQVFHERGPDYYSDDEAF
jgi:predicted DNA-binding WGR domain protein